MLSKLMCSEIHVQKTIKIPVNIFRIIIGGSLIFLKEGVVLILCQENNDYINL